MSSLLNAAAATDRRSSTLEKLRGLFGSLNERPADTRMIYPFVDEQAVATLEVHQLDHARDARAQLLHIERLAQEIDCAVTEAMPSSVSSTTTGPRSPSR